MQAGSPLSRRHATSSYSPPEPSQQHYMQASHNIKYNNQHYNDSMDSFKSESSKGSKYGSNVIVRDNCEDFNRKYASKTPINNHYVDMARIYKENTIVQNQQVVPNAKEFMIENDLKVYSRGLQDNSNQMVKAINGQHHKRPEKMIRRHTTEYRGPQHLALPPFKNNDSSDSNVECSPVTTHNSNPYPYLIMKKKTSITSSTSEENSDAIAAAIKLRMQAKEWRDNKTPNKVDSLTVDRRRSSSKGGKIKRRGSFNVDPGGEFHMSLDVDREKNVSCSVRNCSTAKSPVMDMRKNNPLQISAEDMKQIANCGARNKNGSLCHFISSDQDNYLSISQALLYQSSGSEAKLDDTPKRKQYATIERSVRKKKSTHSLAFESSDETLCQTQQKTSKPRREEKIPKMEAVDRYRTSLLQQQQRVHESERTHKSKHKPDSNNRKLTHSKSETRAHKVLPGYFLLEDESGCSVPVRITPPERKESLKYQSPSLELLDVGKVTRGNTNIDPQQKESKDACKCKSKSRDSVVKANGSDGSSDEEVSSNMRFRRLGAAVSSREEITTSGDVEESFDF